MADQEARLDLGIAGLGPAEHIGRGGFADVYRAERLSLRRTVAVKVLRARATDPEAEARFRRECHAIGAVSDHPHIVGVHEGGFTSNGRAYLVMEYLPGGSLAERLAAYGPMPVGEVVDTGIKIGQALAVAHRAGVLHRDVKPANIMMSAYGEPALGDFAIARYMGGHRTATGLAIASFAHAAPEALEGQEPTGAADIYSLGSTIFELLTGRAPYFDPSDETVWPLMKRILSEPMPSPESIGMSRQLGWVFARATARSPAERYGHADQLVEALMAVADDPAALVFSPPDHAVTGVGLAGGTTTRRTPVGVGPVPPGPMSGPSGRTAGPAGPPPVTKPDLTSLRRAETGLLPVIGIEQTVDARPAVRPTGGSPTSGTVPGPQRSARAGTTDSDLRLPLAGLAAAALAALLIAGGIWLLLGGGEETGAERGSIASATVSTAVAVLDEATSGPLEAGRPYEVRVVDGPAAARFRLVIDGERVGVPTTTVPVLTPAAGRHSVALEITTPGTVELTAPIELYAIGDPPPAGYRVNLASVSVEDDGWEVALAAFDRLVSDGHADLELLTSAVYAQLVPGFWNLYVTGFGEDVDAAEAYCRRFDLAVPDRCFASYFEPDQGPDS